MWYILDRNNKPIKSNTYEFDKWSNKNPTKRIVKQEYIEDIYISTVFLGLDHSYNSTIPILWETMIFGGKHDQYQVRYSSYKDALKGHQIALNLVTEEKS